MPMLLAAESFERMPERVDRVTVAIGHRAHGPDRDVAVGDRRAEPGHVVDPVPEPLDHEGWKIVVPTK